MDLMLQHSSRSELHALTDVSIVDTLEPLRMDLAKFAHAMVILELLDAAFEVESPHPDFYADLVLGLRTLAYKPMDLAIPLLIQLKMLNALGLLPAESDCQECGKALEGPFYFSFQRGASLCKPCVGNAKAMGIVSGNTWQIPYLESVANKSLQECLDIPIPQDKKRQFFGWIRNILDGVVHKKIRSYDFLSQVGF